MAMLRNLKVKEKLGLGFGALLLITAIITAVGVVNIHAVDSDYTYTFNLPFERYSIMRTLEVQLVDLRRIAVTGALRMGNVEALDALERDLAAIRGTMQTTLDQFLHNFYSDRIVYREIRDLRLVEARYLGDMIFAYLSMLEVYGLAAARAGDVGFIENMFPVAEEISEGIHVRFYGLLNDIRMHMASRVEQNNQTARTTMALLGALGLGSLLVGLAVSALITNSITRPVRKVAEALEDVADGYLEVSLRTDGEDEAGALTRSARNLAETLQALMREMDHMSRAHDKGDIDVFIPAEKFTGAYSKVAEKINYMVSAHLDTQNKVLEVLAEITDGNFDVRLEQLPGKKALLNDIVNSIRDAAWRRQQIYDASPIASSLWDDNLNAIDCNEAMVSLLEMSGKEDYLNRERFFRFAPERQPEGGVTSAEKLLEISKVALGKRQHRFVWMHHTARQEPVPCDVSVVRIDLKDRHLFATYLQDLRPFIAAAEKERELEISERIRLMFEATPLIIEYWDKDLHPIDCNRTALDYYGFSTKEEYKESLVKATSHFSPDGTPLWNLWNARLEEIFETGSNDFEFVEQKPNDDTVFMKVRGIRMRYNDELVVVTYSNDVTELKETEDAIAQAREAERESNEYNQAILDASPYVIGLWDDKGNLMKASDQGKDFFGVPDPKMIADDLFAYSPALQPCGTPTPVKAKEYSDRVYREGYVRFEWLHRRTDGELVPAECIYKLFTREGKNMILSFTRDLREIKATEKKEKEAQEALKQRERMLDAVNQVAEVLLTANDQDTMRALMTGMEIAGRCVDADRVQIWRNEIIDGELCFVMRYEWLSEVGKRRKEVPIGLSGRYSERPHWLEMFLRGESMNTPISKLPPEDAAFLGYYEMVSIVNMPLFLNDEFIGFFSVDDCKSERVFTDDEMDMFASAGLMFASVFHRNLQAKKIDEANRQLETALDQALSASRAKSDFLSSMSHEMRTPMNAIIGMTTIAKSERDAERKGAALDKVEKAANHLLDIINDVLDMSRIEANKLELQHVEIDLRGLLQKAVSFVEFRMEEKRHRFSMDLDDDALFFYVGDELRLTQIITNLLANAVIYTPEGGDIKLSVSLTKEEDGICELLFEVADSGIGISLADQSRLFEMFERGEDGASRKQGGTGLGLAISKRLIELMGGSISVDSELGKGARFVFTVRLERIEKGEEGFPAHPDSAAESRDGDASADGAPQFAGKRLLLAEDIEINREILIAYLDGTGLEIDIACDGKEAVRMIAAKPRAYDLVLMDIQMPEMDGLEATRRIRALPESEAKRVPIVAMTANVFTEDIEHCLAAGMNDHIGKPLDMRIMFEKLRKYL